MVGSNNGTMISVRLVHSKLRKREEHSNSVHPTDVVLEAAVAPPADLHSTTNMVLPGVADVRSLPPPLYTAPGHPVQLQTVDGTYSGHFLWQLPPSTTATSQSYLYSSEHHHHQEALVQSLSKERHGFVRVMRKNLGGRWRRFVQRKPPSTEVYTIPAELKPQLKQIYVY